MVRTASEFHRWSRNSNRCLHPKTHPGVSGIRTPHIACVYERSLWANSCIQSGSDLECYRLACCGFVSVHSFGHRRDRIPPRCLQLGASLQTTTPGWVIKITFVCFSQGMLMPPLRCLQRGTSQQSTNPGWNTEEIRALQGRSDHATMALPACKSTSDSFSVLPCKPFLQG